MILFKNDSGELGAFPKTGIEIVGNIIKNVSGEIIIVKPKGNLLIKSSDDKVTNILKPDTEYNIIEEENLVEKYLEQTEFVDNPQILKLFVGIKEYTILRKLIKIDPNRIETLEAYENALNESKNFRFIKDLQVYNIIVNPEELKIFKKIYKLRDTIFKKMVAGEKNHVIYGFNNPYIWLPVDYKIKRIIAGCLQYRKGKHHRFFELAVFNIGLINKFPLTEEKIEYSNIMKKYGLLM